MGVSESCSRDPPRYGAYYQALQELEQTPPEWTAAVYEERLQTISHMLRTDPALCEALVNEEEERALHVAARRNRPDIVRYLLRMGADVNAVAGSSGDTPLHVAAAHDAVPAARMLLRWEAKLRVRNKRQQWPSQLGSERTRRAIAAMKGELGIDSGSDEDSADGGDTGPHGKQLVDSDSGDSPPPPPGFRDEPDEQKSGSFEPPTRPRFKGRRSSDVVSSTTMQRTISHNRSATHAGFSVVQRARATGGAAGASGSASAGSNEESKGPRVVVTGTPNQSEDEPDMFRQLSGHSMASYVSDSEWGGVGRMQSMTVHVRDSEAEDSDSDERSAAPGPPGRSPITPHAHFTRKRSMSQGAMEPSMLRTQTVEVAHGTHADGYHSGDDLALLSRPKAFTVSRSMSTPKRGKGSDMEMPQVREKDPFKRRTGMGLDELSRRLHRTDNRQIFWDLVIGKDVRATSNERDMYRLFFSVATCRYRCHVGEPVIKDGKQVRKELKKIAEILVRVFHRKGEFSITREQFMNTFARALMKVHRKLGDRRKKAQEVRKSQMLQTKAEMKKIMKLTGEMNAPVKGTPKKPPMTNQPSIDRRVSEAFRANVREMNMGLAHASTVRF